MSSNLLSVPEAAERLNLAEVTLRGMTRRREISHVQIGRRVLISEQQLQAFVEKHVVEPGPTDV